MSRPALAQDARHFLFTTLESATRKRTRTLGHGALCKKKEMLTCLKIKL